GTADAFAALRRIGEQILQIAGRGEQDRAAVEQVVREAHELAFALGNARMHRLIGIEEPRPGRLRNLGGQGSRARAAIKGVVVLPKRKPLLEVVAAYGTNDQR